MMGMLEQLVSVARNRTTYRTGLIQARAYRILKQETTHILKPLGISSTEWAFLGLVHDAKQMRMKDVAEGLGVEAPFVTAMIQQLLKKELIEESRDEKDSRVKYLSLTKKGNQFVISTEKLVRSKIRRLVRGISPRDLVGYLSVLEAIIKNDKY